MSVRLVSNRRNTGSGLHSDRSRIVDSIKSIARGLRTSGKQSLQVPGITTAQLHVLRALQVRDALSINEIAALTFTHQSSVSMVVGRLVREKLVSRAASKTDGRSVSISLTQSGRKILRKSVDSTDVRLSTALDSLNRAELSELAACLEKVSSMLDRHAPDARPRTEPLEA